MRGILRPARPWLLPVASFAVVAAAFHDDADTAAAVARAGGSAALGDEPQDGAQRGVRCGGAGGAGSAGSARGVARRSERPGRSDGPRGAAFRIPVHACSVWRNAPRGAATEARGAAAHADARGAVAGGARSTAAAPA